MYQSLYRKYRPQNFNEVVGQDVIVKTLKNTIINNKLTHAYLFTGPRGTGKTSIAKIFAKTINCENSTNAMPCEKCVCCTQINEHKSVDIIELDAASNNGVDEIRELISKASLVPATAKYKIYIIDEVHMLTTGAFNALLKTLEEPPAHVIFVLATTEPHKIPITILSRCQRFDFKKIPQEQMITKLKEVADLEKIKAKEEVYKEITRLSDGCMRDALSILDQVIAYSNSEITIDDIHEVSGTVSKNDIISYFEAILDKDYEASFNWIDTFDAKGKNFVKLAEELMLIIRDIMLYVNVPNYEFTEEERELYNTVSCKVNYEDIISYVKKINEAIVDMKKTNNVKIVFEILTINMLGEKDIQIDNKENQIDSKKDKTSENVPKKEEKEQIQETVSEINEAIKEETTKKEGKKSKKDTNDSIIVQIESLKNIRINNTLCNFDKKSLTETKKALGELQKQIMDPDIAEYVSIILDGELKAVGNEYFIFLYKTKNMEVEFNKKLVQIDGILSDFFKKPCKAIATNDEDWAEIKNEFNSKSKKYEMMEEPKNIESILKNTDEDNNLIDNMFGEIVEYN